MFTEEVKEDNKTRDELTLSMPQDSITTNVNGCLALSVIAYFVMYVEHSVENPNSYQSHDKTYGHIVCEFVFLFNLDI